MLSTTKMHNPSILKINGFGGSEHEQDARKNLQLIQDSFSLIGWCARFNREIFCGNICL